MSTLLIAGGAFAQSPTFEVASIKPAAPQDAGRVMIRMGGDPGRIDYKHVPVRLLIANAYDVKDFQIVAPDWMATEFFDVEAKLPPDTTPENRRLMMQNLLAERFGLKVHRETKEASVYALVVGKNGPKMKKSEETPAPPADGPGGGGAPGARLPNGPVSPADMAKAVRAAGTGTMMMRMGNGGKMTLAAKTTMANLSDMLARQVGKPVMDETGLKGNYDLELEFAPAPGQMGAMMKGLAPPMPHGDGAAPDASAAPENDAASIFTAVQEQLGLKLEPKKGPVTTIVVDRAEKTPTEN